GLLYGRPRSLAAACRHVLGAEPPKAHATSVWSAPRLSAGQLSYAAADAALCWYVWVAAEPEMREQGRWVAYRLQAGAIPAVTDMQLSGLLLEREEHDRQTAAWCWDLAAARAEYP